MRGGENAFGFGLLTETIESFRVRVFECRAYGPLLVPAWLYPEAIAEVHDYAIISHNHFVRLRQAERRERKRLDGEARLSARWSRLWRRYASKCPTCSCGLGLTFGGGPYRLEGLVGPFCGNCLRGIGTKADWERAEREAAPDSDAEHDAARLQWYGATDERSRLDRGEDD